MGFFGKLQEKRLINNITQHRHYFTVPFFWFRNEGVFKYDHCILKTGVFMNEYQISRF